MTAARNLEWSDGAAGPALAALAIEEARDWQAYASCAEADPEAFFVEKGQSTRDAKRICAGCFVRTQCLEYALDTEQIFGVWGGTSENERKRIRRERREAAA